MDLSIGAEKKQKSSTTGLPVFRVAQKLACKKPLKRLAVLIFLLFPTDKSVG